MPAPIDEIVKRRVVQQWLAGEPREKIIADNDIGSGTVSIIVDEYKAGLDNFDLDSFRELTIEAKKREISSSNLASFFRLYNFFKRSGTKENEVESFITNINSGYITSGKAIELINQIYEITKSQSVPPDQLPEYIKEKLEEKKKIDDDIQQVDTVLQSRNISIETINAYQKLNEKLNGNNLSFGDIDKLLNVLENAKRYGFGGKEIADKLWSIQNLEWKEKELKDKCNKLSKKMSKYKDVVRLTEDIAATGINMNELLGLKIAIDQAAKQYNLPFVSATMRLIDDIKKYNKINDLKNEINNLCLQKFAINEAYSSQYESLIALAKLKSYGMNEDRILQLNNFLKNNGYEANSYTNNTYLPMNRSDD